MCKVVEKSEMRTEVGDGLKRNGEMACDEGARNEEC